MALLQSAGLVPSVLPSRNHQLALVPRKALVVDDLAVNRLILGRILGKLGFDVIEAENGYQCMEAYQKERTAITCIFLDLQMPLMDGWQATKGIRRLESASGHRRVPVVVCTASCLEEMVGDETVAQRSLSLGADGAVKKPLCLSAVQNILDTFAPCWRTSVDAPAASCSSPLATPAPPAAKPTPCSAPPALPSLPTVAITSAAAALSGGSCRGSPMSIDRPDALQHARPHPAAPLSARRHLHPRHHSTAHHHAHAFPYAHLYRSQPGTTYSGAEPDLTLGPSLAGAADALDAAECGSGSTDLLHSGLKLTSSCSDSGSGVALLLESELHGREREHPMPAAAGGFLVSAATVLMGPRPALVHRHHSLQGGCAASGASGGSSVRGGSSSGAVASGGSLGSGLGMGVGAGGLGAAGGGSFGGVHGSAPLIHTHSEEYAEAPLRWGHSTRRHEPHLHPRLGAVPRRLSCDMTAAAADGRSSSPSPAHGAAAALC